MRYKGFNGVRYEVYVYRWVQQNAITISRPHFSISAIIAKKKNQEIQFKRINRTSFDMVSHIQARRFYFYGRKMKNSDVFSECKLHYFTLLTFYRLLMENGTQP